MALVNEPKRLCDCHVKGVPAGATSSAWKVDSTFFTGTLRSLEPRLIPTC